MIKGTMAAVACVMATLAAQRPPAPSTGDLVELDVVVLGRDGQTVSFLRRDDFAVRDDGRRIDIKTFDEITSTGPSDDARSVVLLLDDIGVSLGGTSPMRGLARLVISSAKSADDVAVIRVSKSNDEAFGDANMDSLR